MAAPIYSRREQVDMWPMWQCVLLLFAAGFFPGNTSGATKRTTGVRQCHSSHSSAGTAAGQTNRPISREFRDVILSKYSNDLVGRVCQTDATILNASCALFDKMKKKQDKQSKCPDGNATAGQFIFDVQRSDARNETGLQ